MEPSAADGNKRAAWASLVLFIDINEESWNDEHPDSDDAVAAMLAKARTPRPEILALIN